MASLTCLIFTEKAWTAVAGGLSAIAVCFCTCANILHSFGRKPSVDLKKQDVQRRAAAKVRCISNGEDLGVGHVKCDGETLRLPFLPDDNNAMALNGMFVRYEGNNVELIPKQRRIQQFIIEFPEQAEARNWMQYLSHTAKDVETDDQSRLAELRNAIKVQENVLKSLNQIMQDLEGRLTNGMPSNAEPSDAVPNNAVPRDALPSDAVPSKALPHKAVPSDAVASDILLNDAVASDAVFCDAVPSDAVSSDAVPCDAVTSDVVPRDAVASDPVPCDAMPSDAVASNALPSDAVPSDVVPRDALPTDVVASDDVPNNAVPSDVVPRDALPGDAVVSDDMPNNAVPSDAVASDAIANDAVPCDAGNDAMQLDSWKAGLSNAGNDAIRLETLVPCDVASDAISCEVGNAVGIYENGACKDVGNDATVILNAPQFELQPAGESNSATEALSQVASTSDFDQKVSQPSVTPSAGAVSETSQGQLTVPPYPTVVTAFHTNGHEKDALANVSEETRAAITGAQQILPPASDRGRDELARRMISTEQKLCDARAVLGAAAYRHDPLLWSRQSMISDSSVTIPRSSPRQDDLLSVTTLRSSPRQDVQEVRSLPAVVLSSAGRSSLKDSKGVSPSPQRSSPLLSERLSTRRLSPSPARSPPPGSEVLSRSSRFRRYSGSEKHHSVVASALAQRQSPLYDGRVISHQSLSVPDRSPNSRASASQMILDITSQARPTPPIVVWNGPRTVAETSSSPSSYVPITPPSQSYVKPMTPNSPSYASAPEYHQARLVGQTPASEPRQASLVGQSSSVRVSSYDDAYRKNMVSEQPQAWILGQSSAVRQSSLDAYRTSALRIDGRGSLVKEARAPAQSMPNASKALRRPASTLTQRLRESPYTVVRQSSVPSSVPT